MSDNKKHLPISVLLMAFIALGVITSSVITGFIAIKLFHNEQTEQDEADLVRTAEGVNNTLEDYLETLTGCAKILAQHPDFIRQTLSLLREDEVDADLLENTSETLDIELMAIVGTNAKILNGYGLSDGIDVSDVAAVSHTLQTQESFLSYEDIGEATFAMLASQPIYNDNNMIGVLIVGYDLAADDFISGIHANYNVDCTIFRETTRVATTLTGIGGKSLIGTKLDNQMIISQVLNGGVQFVGTNMINGKKYSSIYSPLKSSDDSISGMISLLVGELWLEWSMDFTFGQTWMIASRSEARMPPFLGRRSRSTTSSEKMTPQLVVKWNAAPAGSAFFTWTSSVGFSLTPSRVSSVGCFSLI